MSGKFALFFLVAVCLAQGYQSRVAEPRGLIEDAINAIKDIIEKIKNAISEIISQLPDIIKNLQDKIKDIISNIDLNEIIQNIRDKIQEAVDNILALAGVDPEAVKDCIDAEKDAVEQLTTETVAGIGACKQAADDEVAKLGKELEELKTRADKLIKDSTGSIKQCIDEHGIDVVGVVECLKGHLEELKTDADALIEQVKTTIAVGKDKLQQVPAALANCIAEVSTQAAQKQKDIIDDFKKCVDAHGQEPETTQEPELTTSRPEQ